MKADLKLDHKISFSWLMLFALPTIFSSVFMNLYSTVDGIFVARWVDTDALSAINITMPMIFLVSALGMMFGTGGNALVARKIGEGKTREAQEDFSLLMVTAFVFSVTLAVLCFVFLDPL
jgi:Na+-driven multidrug efflux pump